MLKSISNLPLDIMREISEYTDTVYWCKRAKKFITRFSKQDERYDILKNGIAPMQQQQCIILVLFHNSYLRKFIDTDIDSYEYYKKICDAHIQNLLYKLDRQLESKMNILSKPFPSKKLNITDIR